MTQKPHLNEAWNVKNILDAALEMKDADRMSKHIVLEANTEQRIPVPTVGDTGVVSAPAGTAFDPEPVPVKVEGNMGDVIEVDLKRRAAFALLGITLVPPDKESTLDDTTRQALTTLMKGMEGFSLALGVRERLTGPSEGANPASANPVSDPPEKYLDFTLATNADGTELSRDANLGKAEFKRKGGCTSCPISLRMT